MQSIQPTNTPRKVTTKLMTNLTAPPFFEKGGPPDDDLDDPVDDRDQQQYELNETALSVKPSNCLCLLIELEFLPLIIIYHIFPFRNVCDKSFTYLCDKKHMGINAAGAYRGQTPKATATSGRKV